MRLVEVRRPSRWNTQHVKDARRYLRGLDIPGWEAQHDVVPRVGEALDEHWELAGHRRLVAVGHGISAALWLASALSIDAGRWWKSLRFPDVWEVNLHARTAHRIEPIT